MRRRFCLWGWRRGDWGYAIVTGQEAARDGREVIGCPDYARDYATVAWEHK